MNKALFGILSAVVLLNTACSPKQDETPVGSAQSSAAASISSDAMDASSSQPAAAPTPTYSPANAELQDTYWKLMLLNETEVKDGGSQREAHIIFGPESRISGSDGCNNYMGTYMLAGEEVTFSQMATTKMACESGAEQPQAFSDALAAVASYNVHADQLELRNSEGTVIARFRAVDKPSE